MNSPSNLLHLLYGSAVGSCTLPEALSGFGAELGYGVAAVVAPQGTLEGKFCLDAVGADRDDWDELERTQGLSASLLNPKILGERAGAVLRLSDAVQLGGSPAARDFMRRNGLQDGVAILMDGSRQHPQLLYLGAPLPSVDPKLREEKLQQVAQHAGLALQVAQAVRREELLRRAQASAISILPYPAVVLDGAGTVLVANARAQQELNGDGLALGPAGLRAQIESDNAQLMQAIRKLLGVDGKTASVDSVNLRLHRRSGKSPLQVFCTRIAGADAAANPLPGVMVIVHDPETPLDIDTARLKECFGLTGAEANVAKGVMQGKSLQEIATENRNSVVTTRNLLKRVFSKTGARRQSELATMLLRSPLIHGA